MRTYIYLQSLFGAVEDLGSACDGLQRVLALLSNDYSVLRPYDIEIMPQQEQGY